VKLLLEKGAELETKDNVSRTPLSYAASNGQEAVVKLLLEKGAELETKDNVGQTPLLWAAEYGHEAVVKLLLAKDDVDPNPKDTDGCVPASRISGGHNVNYALHDYRMQLMLIGQQNKKRLMMAQAV
jgi:ankyrin repeat protein